MQCPGCLWLYSGSPQHQLHSHQKSWASSGSSERISCCPAAPLHPSARRSLEWAWKLQQVCFSVTLAFCSSAFSLFYEYPVKLHQMPTYKPSAMHSNSSISPLRTILVLVVPGGIMKLGRCSPSGLSADMTTNDQIRSEQQNEILKALFAIVTTGGFGEDNEGLSGPFILPWREQVLCTVKWRSVMKWFLNLDRRECKIPTQHQRGSFARRVVIGLFLWQHGGSLLVERPPPPPHLSPAPPALQTSLRCS